MRDLDDKNLYMVILLGCRGLHKSEIKDLLSRSQDISFPEEQRTHIAQEKKSRRRWIPLYKSNSRPLPSTSFSTILSVGERCLRALNWIGLWRCGESGSNLSIQFVFNRHPVRITLNQSVHNIWTSSHLEEEDNTTVKLEHTAARSACSILISTEPWEFILKKDHHHLLSINAIFKCGFFTQKFHLRSSSRHENSSLLVHFFRGRRAREKKLRICRKVLWRRKLLIIIFN